MATIVGTLGNDPQIIDPINQADEIFGDSTGDLGPSVVSGSDRIFGRDFDDSIFGDANELFGAETRGGNDVIFGGKGGDFIFGDAVSISMGARGGDDTLNQGAGTGFMFGDAQLLQSGAHGGNDRLTGAGFALIGDAADLVGSTGGKDVLDATGAGEGSVLVGDAQNSLFNS